MKEQICKNCEHYSGSRYSRCDIKLPFWAEPYSRPTVYGQDGGGCPAYREYNLEADDPEEIIATKDAEIAQLREALTDLITAYLSSVDTCRTAGFYSDPNEDEEIIAARAALEATPDPAGGMPVVVKP